MYSIFKKVSSVFWSEKFWLVPNTTWADWGSDEITRLPAASDMLIPLFIGVGLFLVRLLWER